MPKSTFDQKQQQVDQQQNAAGNIYNVSQAENDAFQYEEIIHNAGAGARTLIRLGTIVMIGGFVAAAGAVVTGAIGIFFLAFGPVVVGMIAYGIGYQMARSEAYKRHLKSRQK